MDALRRVTAIAREPISHTRVRLDNGDMLLLDYARFLNRHTEIAANAARNLGRLKPWPNNVPELDDAPSADVPSRPPKS